MTCLQCQRLDLRTYPDHARVGLGTCKRGGLKGVFVSITFNRNCDGFQRADDETVRTREEWKGKRNGNAKG